MPKHLTLCKGQTTCTGDTGFLYLVIESNSGCDLHVVIAPKNGKGPNFLTSSPPSPPACQNFTAAQCTQGIIQVNPEVVAGSQEGDYDVFINNQPYYNVISVVPPCCTCSSSSECMCTNQTVDNGLTVSILSSDLQPHPGPIVVTIGDNNGKGPKIDDGSANGTRTYTFSQCPDSKSFKIIAGDLQGSFPVNVSFNGSPATCGSICVFGRVNAQPVAFQYQIGCTKGNKVSIDEGTPPLGLPKPNQQIPGGANSSAVLLGQLADTCGSTISWWCDDSRIKYLISGPAATGKIAECVFDPKKSTAQVSNAIVIFFSTCGSSTRIVNTTEINQALINGNNELGIWQYDNCSGILDLSYSGSTNGKYHGPPLTVDSNPLTAVTP